MRDLSRRHVTSLLLAAAAPIVVLKSSAGAESAPLAIRGYDPVAYFTLGKPVRGLPEIEYGWDEHRYNFTSTAHRELFKTDPVRYAPQFAGYCAMALTRAELDEGNPENWLIRDGRLYLFGKPIGPGLFQQGFNENVDTAGQNLAQIQKR